MSNTKPKVVLLVGGTSPEREVSKSSGKGILGALRNLGYPTKIIDPAYGENQPEDESSFFRSEDYTGISNRNCVTAINSSLFNDVDVVFSALHGKWAEDGTIQSLLELRGLKYTGSKVLASAMAMDKSISKTIFRNAGVKTADWFSIRENEFDIKAIIKNIKSGFGYPCVIKPNDQGSTVGLSIVKKKSEVEEACRLAFKFSVKILIEQYIPGREITVAVLENQALPVLEIIPKSGFYDYKSKYTAGMTEYIVPAQIPPKVFKLAQKQALLAFNSLGCEGYARVDFRLNNKIKIFCLEVNTLPGMTPTSLVPKMAKAVGISFEELIDRIVRQALQ
jgi:D-alanine-D-alanine ligase